MRDTPTPSPSPKREGEIGGGGWRMENGELKVN